MAAMVIVIVVSLEQVLRVSLGTVRSPRTTVMSVQAAREKFYALAGATYGLNINGATGYVAKAVSPAVSFKVEQYYKELEGLKY